MKHQRARSDTTSCVSKSAGRAHDNVHGTTARRCARYFFDHAEMPMAQGFSHCSVFSTITAGKANARYARACRRPRNGALSIPSDLCKKSSVDGPVNLLASTRSGSNRANRPASDSLKSTESGCDAGMSAQIPYRCFSSGSRMLALDFRVRA